LTTARRLQILGASRFRQSCCGPPAPDLYRWPPWRRDRRRYRRYIIEHMMHGDSRAAIVVSVDPLLVAAYTDELDCVALLHFASDSVTQRLEIGSRLLTVNTYATGEHFSPDLVVGPRQLGRWARFHPIIADFICADREQVERRKQEIDEQEWERTIRLGKQYLTDHPGRSRDGAPCHSASPAHTRA